MELPPPPHLQWRVDGGMHRLGYRCTTVSPAPPNGVYRGRSDVSLDGPIAWTSSFRYDNYLRRTVRADTSFRYPAVLDMAPFVTDEVRVKGHTG